MKAELATEIDLGDVTLLPGLMDMELNMLLGGPSGGNPRSDVQDDPLTPEELAARIELADFATDVGFAGVMSGPLVRSSYRAGRLYEQALAARATGENAPSHREMVIYGLAAHGGKLQDAS